MARKKDFLKSDPMADIEAQINADFNALKQKMTLENLNLGLVLIKEVKKQLMVSGLVKGPLIQQ